MNLGDELRQALDEPGFPDAALLDLAMAAIDRPLPSHRPLQWASLGAGAIAATLVVTLVAIHLNQASPVAGLGSQQATPARTSSTPSPLPWWASNEPPSASYGLLIAAGKVEMINSSGQVAASAALRPSSVGTCAGGVFAAEPPVSASLDRVYYRDGDTQIRSLTLDGVTQDVTTVPGGPNVVSFFAVSPDDRRIAVEVNTISGATVSELLYVEDLSGGGQHVELYRTNSTQTTLWPMGWYQGQLLLALMPACSADVSRLSPLEWHYASSTNGNRITTINKASCAPEGHPAYLSRWPSPGGVMCTGAFGYASIDTWEGARYQADHFLSGDNLIDAELSPSGEQFVEVWVNPSFGWQEVHRVVGASQARLNGSGAGAYIEGHGPCLWIDETHLLAPDAVIRVPDPNTPGLLPQPGPFVKALVSPVPEAGICAGRYPNPL